MAETMLRKDNTPIRLEYSAAPLNLGHQDPQEKHPNPAYIDYMRDSAESIELKLADALAWAEHCGWVKSPKTKQQLEELLGILLLDSHALRLARNRQMQLDDLIQPGDDRPEKAMQGCATPLEILSLLEDYPHLDTLGVAELSHPLDAAAPDEMNDAVLSAIARVGGSVTPHEPYYKMKGYASILPAATVLRKQVVGDYAAGDGRIQVTKRETFLVRADQEARHPDKAVKFMIEEEVAFGELAQKIENYRPHLREHPNLRWLQPLVTSYYAKYLPEAEATQKSA